MDDHAITHLADWYYVQVIEYKKINHKEIKKHIRRTISYSWNMLGDLDINQKLVSKAAYDEFQKLKTLGKDIRDMSWSDQVRSIDNGGLGGVGRKVFHWEHAFTRNDFVTLLLDSESNLTREDIANIVKQHQIIWILKNENEILNKMKRYDGVRYDRSRPDGWRKVYEEAGIEILD